MMTNNSTVAFLSSVIPFLKAFISVIVKIDNFITFSCVLGYCRGIISVLYRNTLGRYGIKVKILVSWHHLILPLTHIHTLIEGDVSSCANH